MLINQALKIVKSLALVCVFLALTGFDFAKHSIPLNEIHSGGPGKDGIPALDHPKFLAAEKAARQIKDPDRVLGLAFGGESKAYPISILNWHEVVNDRIGGRNVVITFCPLCGTGMVFDGEVGEKQFTFGVSGLLYQSDVLLYDRQTESLWSQIKMAAVTGSMTGAKLTLLPSVQTTWGQWKKTHPESRLLSRKTGFRRNYDRDPYSGYEKSLGMGPGVKKVNPRFHPKEKIIGIEIAGAVKAYPFSVLAQAKLPVEDQLGGTVVRIYYDDESQTAIIRDKKGNELASVVGFWFAWFAFHPNTEIYMERGQ